jgi:trigger factor
VKVIREKAEQSQVWLTIEMAPDEVQTALDESYRRLVKRVKVPGFRKGKTPRVILERHVGKESLLDDAIENLLPGAYQKAIKEQAIEPITRPEIEIAQTDPLVFKAGDYRSLRITQDEVNISGSDVDSVIEQMRHQKANWQPVERAVEAGDLVVMDIESSLEDHPFINRKEMQYQVLTDSPFPAPGFSLQLVGIKPDGEKEFKLQFPQDDSRSELAGKEANFKVRVVEVKEEILPELNDEFAREVDPELSGLEQLRENIITELKNRDEQRVKDDFETKVCDEVVSLSKMEFPPVMVAVEVDRIIDEQMRRWQQSLENYLKMINKTEEELRDELKPVAEKRVTRSLVLEEVAKTEEIAASDDEINAEIDNLTKDAGESQDELKKMFGQPDSRKQVAQILVTRKTLARLTQIAEGAGETAGVDEE